MQTRLDEILFMETKIKNGREGTIMALIKCPECGKEISDKAENCIHCGYPIASLGKEKYATDQYTVILESSGVNKVKIIKIVREITGIDLKAAKEAVESVPYIITDKVSLEDATAVKNKFDGEGAIVSIVSSDNKNIKIATTESNQIRCPRCGSTQITTGQRGFSFWTGFIGANKTVNRCAKCGHSWQPR